MPARAAFLLRKGLRTAPHARRGMLAYNAVVSGLDGNTIVSFAGSLLSFGAGIAAFIPLLKKKQIQGRGMGNLCLVLP